MGVKISIDKHVSELDDILEMSPHYLSRVQFESKIGPEITQHLKVSFLDNLKIFCRSGDFTNLRKVVTWSNPHLCHSIA
jgi:hypothetical protein